MQVFLFQYPMLIGSPAVLQPRPLRVYQRMSCRRRQVLRVSVTLAFDQFQSPPDSSSAGACPCARSLQSCLTLCNPLDRSPPGCSVRGILQARILEWVAISFSRGSS